MFSLKVIIEFDPGMKVSELKIGEAEGQKPNICSGKNIIIHLAHFLISFFSTPEKLFFKSLGNKLEKFMHITFVELGVKRKLCFIHFLCENLFEFN